MRGWKSERRKVKGRGGKREYGMGKKGGVEMRGAMETRSSKERAKGKGEGEWKWKGRGN